MSRAQARSVAEQIYRMKLLDVAVFAINAAQYISEHRAVRREYNKKDIVEYWALRVAIDKKLISIILRKRGTGNIIFYSIWKGGSKKTVIDDDLL